MLPDIGDIAWIEFDPVKGTEQSGRRPGLILTSRGYHQRSRRAIVCPITSNEKPWAFNVPLPPEMKIKGSVLVDQVRTIDRQDRMFDIIERVPAEVLSEVRGRLAALLEFDVVSSVGDPGQGA
jgi:mRNA interferase MazF